MGSSYKRPWGRKAKGESVQELTEKVVAIARVAKVVKGGRRFSFSALAVVGDENGHVGYGLGKANEVPDAISKAGDTAKKRMISVPRVGTTVPFEVVGQYGSARVLLKPASPGTGVIAGATVRAVLEKVGIKDVLTKSFGSRNPHNVLGAVFDALLQLDSPEAVAFRRNKQLDELKYQPFGA
jgi:small subunit ribosomal protein S5